MKPVHLAAAVFAFIGLGSAYAADLPTRDHAPVLKGPSAVAPAFSWAGFYAGADAGYVNSFAHTVFLNAGNPFYSTNANGATLGLLAGYNFEAGNLVLGLEGDGALMSGLGSKFPANPVGTITLHSREDASGHIRARFGYAFGSTLVYAAAGMSLADEKLSLTGVGVPTLTITKTMLGYSLGAGAEYSFTPHWIGRLEYIHDEFGSRFFDYGALNPAYTNRTARLRDDQVRAALIYKF
ncbi:MAG: outer membrane beta-barrel protein [Hyphomicrobiales bacterium]|nr:outer membrane beta-barrel protein [Hyphomicrobiales bacterium]